MYLKNSGLIEKKKDAQKRNRDGRYSDISEILHGIKSHISLAVLSFSVTSILHDIQYCDSRYIAFCDIPGLSIHPERRNYDIIFIERHTILL